MSIRVLLVDDQTLVRAGFRALLDSEPDLEVVGEAVDGREAIQLARQHRPDVVLMDIRMPVMDGYEATRAIRALPRADAAAVPIIAMTADAFEDDVKKCREAGMNEHIAKPIDPEKLYMVLIKQFTK